MEEAAAGPHRPVDRRGAGRQLEILSVAIQQRFVEKMLKERKELLDLPSIPLKRMRSSWAG